MSIETMTKLATYTVSAAGGDSSVTFSNIPQTYTDLKLLLSVRTTYNTWLDIYMSFNGNASSGYSYRRLQGDGGSVTSNNSTAAGAIVGNTLGTDSTSSTFSSHSIDISNYTSSNYKSVSFDSVTENNATTAFSSLVAGLSTTTAGITSITFTLGANNYAQHSTFTLYGIKNARKTAGNSIKATGGNISFDGTYVVHTFTSSGTFTPTAPIARADYLVVAGGGGASGGGGGAGGLRSTVTATGGGGSLESPLSLTANTSYTVTVGAGGAGGVNTSGSGSSGSNSVFGSITSTGGGFGAGGGNGSATTGGAGGSGGGGWIYNNVTTASGGARTASPVQGNNGGYVDGISSNAAGGAGGGAGAAGNPAIGGIDGGAPSYQNGQKAAGVAVSISGSSATYGQGGRGYFIFPAVTPLDGPANSGNGGDAPNSGGGQTGKIGGSGIVIIRYKA